MNVCDMKNMMPVVFGLIKMSFWVQELKRQTVIFGKVKLLRIPVNGQKNSPF